MATEEGGALASLSIRKLDDEVYEQLRARAARHGVSMEEEARRILVRAVSPPERMGDLFLKIFGPEHGGELEIPLRESHAPIDLS
jgi:plasmid stability protein